VNGIDTISDPTKSGFISPRQEAALSRPTMSLAEAAEVLGIHRTTAWSLYKRGDFPVPVLKVGSNLRVVKAHLQMFLETGQPFDRQSHGDSAAPSTTSIQNQRNITRIRNKYDDDSSSWRTFSASLGQNETTS
jgi:predicted DNA-binding transcriptional regulator AlpA